MQQWCNSCTLQICSPSASSVLALSLSRKVGSDPGEILSLSRDITWHDGSQNWTQPCYWLVTERVRPLKLPNVRLSKGNIAFCFPQDPQSSQRRRQSLSILFYLQTQNWKIVRRTRLFYAGWFINFPRFQGARTI